MNKSLSDRVTLAGASAVLLVGMIGLAGWIFSMPSLLRVWRGAPVMACDTAILLVFAGVGLLSLRAAKARLTLLCGAVLVLVAGASKLTESSPRFFVSIHRFFPQRTATVIGTTDPILVRMVLPTVLICIFLLLGTVLLASAKQRRKSSLLLWSTAASGTVLVSLGSLGLIAAVCKLSLRAEQGSFLSQMSPVSAFAALILGLSLCAQFAGRSQFASMRAGLTSAIFGLVSLVLLIAGVDYAVVSGGQEMLNSQAQLASVQKSIKGVQALAQAVERAETDQRGFFLTKDARYLSNYAEGMHAMRASLNIIRVPPSFEAQTRELIRLVEIKSKELAETVTLVKQGRQSAALEIIEHSNRGWLLSTEIRQQVDRLVATYQVETQKALQTNKQAAAFSQKIVICSFFLSALLIGTAVYLVLLEYRRWVSDQAYLREAETTLEIRVRERTRELRQEAARREIAEVAYRRAQASFQTALEFSDVAAWVWDPQVDSIIWSGPVHRIFDATAEDLSSYERLRNLIHPDDQERVNKEIRTTMIHGRDYETEFRLTLPRDGIRWIAARGRALFEQSRVVQVCGVNFDITQSKETEIELRTREQSLRAKDEKLTFILENAAIGDWSWNIANDRLFAHRLVWTLHDSLEQRRGKPLSWFAARQHPEDRSFVEKAIQDATQGHRSLNVDYRVITVDGDIRWISCRGTAVFDDNNHATHIHGLITDITDRKRLELQLKESEAQFRHLADAMPQIVWQARSDGQVDEWNERWYQLIDETKSVRADKTWMDVLHPDEHQIFRDRWQLAVRSGEPFEMEMRLQHKQQYRWFLSRSIPIRDPHDEVVRWFGTSTDIHQQKIAKEVLELEVESRTEELRCALREKDVLFQEVHHRVKNNLQVITSLLRMQGNTVQESAAQAALKEAQERVLSMAFIHERLYSAPNMDELDFVDYARALTKSLSHSYSQNPQVRTIVKGDCILLNVKQAIPCGLILNELVTNAFKYAYPNSSSGEITVNLEEIADLVTLTVTDDGVGLPLAYDLTKSKTLGISIVETLAQQLGGTLSIESQQGARFCVRFARN